MNPRRAPGEGIEEGHRTVTEAAVHGFGTLTGDYARMHFDHEFGRSLDAGGPIAHGLLNASWALGALTRAAPDRLLIHEPRARVAAFSVRFTKAVNLGDTLAVRWSSSDEHALELSKENSELALSTAFEVPDQHARVTSRGLVTVLRDEPETWTPKIPQPWKPTDWRLPASPSTFYAEDLLEAGPRGDTCGQTLTLADAVNFAREVGELNPRTLNIEFAKQTPVGERVVPPMLIFCLGFAEFLQTLLTAPMPSSGFAGHLGDSWRAFRPALIGDTIRTRHRPLDCRPSRSHPGQAIIRFGLQFLNQRDEVVQDGQVTMMIPSREGTSES